MSVNAAPAILANPEDAQELLRCVEQLAEQLTIVIESGFVELHLTPDDLLGSAESTQREVDRLVKQMRGY